MFNSPYLRAHAERLVVVSHSVADAQSKAVLTEVANDLSRWANELDDLDPPGRGE